MAHIHAVAAECHQMARDKGWHDDPREFGTDIALIHSELSEALEDARNGKGVAGYYEKTSRGMKPCGVPSELADAIIRIFDTAEKWGIDIEASIIEKMEYNSGRSYKHGNKAF